MLRLAIYTNHSVLGVVFSIRRYRVEPQHEIQHGDEHARHDWGGVDAAVRRRVPLHHNARPQGR